MTRIAHTRQAAVLRRHWLGQAAAAGGSGNHLAAFLLLVDAALAVGFAAGLAGGLTALPLGLAETAPWLALGSAAALARGGCALARGHVAASASLRVRTALRRHVVGSCLALPAWERPSEGALMVAAVDGVEAMDGFVARFLPAQRVAGLQPLLIAAVIAVASPVCAGLLLATLVPFVAVMILAGGAAAEESRRQFAALSRLSGLFADRVRALPVVLAFQAEAAEAGRLGSAAEELRRLTMGVLRVAFISSAGLELFAALAVALVAVYAGFSLLHLLPFPPPERLSLAEAVFALALAPEFYLPLRRLAAAYHERQAAETAALALMALEAPARAAAVQQPVFTRAPSIRYEAATILYPGYDRPAVENLNFVAEAGEIAVLWGPSGSGKSSALNLLLGLAPLTGGEVWIDGTALSECGTAAASCAWVGQQPMIVAGTIAENIAMSRPDASRRDIEAAALRAGLAAMLAGRPDGLDTRVDERGSGVSGGERLRIAVARALLKPSAILLLDEPTAHLDPDAEAALIQVIRSAARGRTTIIATHSPAVAALGHSLIRLDRRP